MGRPVFFKFGCSTGWESGRVLFLIRCRAYLLNSQTLKWSLKGSKLLPQEYVSVLPLFLPLSLCLCLFVLLVIWHCFFQHGLQHLQLQSHTLLFSLLLSQLSLPVSGPHFGPYNFPAACICGTFLGEFFLFFQDYFWLCQRLPQWQASVCLSLMSCPLRALCDYFLHVDRYRLKCGQTTYRTCVFVRVWSLWEHITESHLNWPQERFDCVHRKSLELKFIWLLVFIIVDNRHCKCDIWQMAS